MKMTKKEIRDAMKYAKHSLYLSGMPLTAEGEKDCNAVLSGEMTREQLIEKLKQQG
ncbi:MAG: hypothetical protein K0S25_365 [Bacillus sp. (in: firmicutes)]|jgi:hypothetical protein|nr:hypothetical protein [Bacillus sp. (in: firmicutes)]